MYDDYLTVKEVAAMFKCCTKTIYTYIKEGRLKAERFGPRSYRIHIDDLNSLYCAFAPPHRR